jgi:dynein heavy chain, axonemal
MCVAFRLQVYDMTKLARKNVIATQMVACMNPTAGSFLINPRLQRWFATFAIGLPGPVSLMTIYQTFLDGHLHDFDASLDDKFSITLIKGALALHSSVSQTFRKTAANFHYEFNIRHIANVFQGLLVAKPDQFQEPEKFVFLWVHESERVYGDRLVSNSDLDKYNVLAQAACKKAFPNVSSQRQQRCLRLGARRPFHLCSSRLLFADARGFRLPRLTYIGKCGSVLWQGEVRPARVLPLRRGLVR